MLALGYIVPFVILLWQQPSLGPSLMLWFVMGLALAGLGMSVMHDANHGAYSENDSVNYWVGSICLNALGGSTFNWHLQHNVLHHMYTNIVHIDEDINDKLLLKFSPHTPVKGFHRFQWLYAFLFYGLLTLYWVTLKDFIQFFSHIHKGINTYSLAENVKVFVKILLIKIVYFSILFGIPVLVFKLPMGEVVAGFLLMHFVGGVILTTVFQLAHAVEDTAHPLPDAQGIIENDWAIHQLHTTVNFSRHNKWLSWYVGGLNFQVEHHLFPKISHVHYPALSDIVKQTAEEYDIPYLENPTFFEALGSHLSILKQLGKLPDWNEAIG
ncbi:MAG: fatty acid desaturase family protein [Runella sp.]